MATGHPLWEKALHQLPKEDQATLKSHWTGSPTDLIEDIEEHQKATKEKSVIKLRNQKYFVRDVLGKVTTWLQKFVQVGDTIVQHDPGHAALPWAAVRLILQATLNNQEKHAAIVEGLETITHYAIWSKIEEGNLLITYDGHDQLEKEFVKLYAAMLTFMAHSIQFLYSKRGHRLAASLISGDSQLTEDIKNITKSKLSIEGSTRQILSQTTHRQYDLAKTIATSIADLEQPIIRVEKAIESQSQILNHQMNEEILNWASVIPYQNHLQVVETKITPGTGQWLLTDKSFTGWQSSSCSQILWLHGSSGSGKSTLVSILLQTLVATHKDYQTPYPMYFFCSRNTAEPERAIPEHILRCLMRQASSIPNGPPLHPKLQARFSTRRTAGEVSAEEATNIIIETIKDRPLTYIVIDALDECDKRIRHKLFKALDRILSDSTSLVKIFITSRESHGDINSRLKDYPAVCIEAARNQADVDRFVQVEIQQAIDDGRLLDGEVDNQLQAHIEEHLCSGAQGMFRWVELQIQFLCTLHTRSALLRRLGQLPKELEEVYDELYTYNMRKMVREDAEITRKVLSWLLVAQRPLSTREMMTLACPPEEQDMPITAILSLCFDLVRLDKEQDQFRFSHLSVREFLEGRPAEYALMAMHTMATCACLDLATASGWTKGHEYPLFYWPQHAVIAVRGSTEGTIEQLDDFLAPGCESFIQWANVVYGLRRHDIKLSYGEAGRKVLDAINDKALGTYPVLDGAINVKGSPLGLNSILDNRDAIKDKALGVHPVYVVVCFDLPTYLRRLLAEAVTLEKVGAKALNLACRYKKIESVRILLHAGVDVNAYCDDEDESDIWTALMVASEAGNAEIVRLLLANGANIEATYAKGRSALWLATKGRRVEAASLLLEKGADWTQKDNRGNSLLEEAVSSSYGWSKFAQLLLERGAYERETFGRAFRAAARKRKVELVTLFYAVARQIEAPESDYSAALSAASQWGRPDAVKLLLERGTRIDADAFDFREPNPQVLKLLLAYDICNLFYSGSKAYGSALLGVVQGYVPRLESLKLLLAYDTEGVCNPGNAICEAALQHSYDVEARELRLIADSPEAVFCQKRLTEVKLIKDLLHKHAAQAADRALSVARRSRSCEASRKAAKPHIRVSHSTSRHQRRRPEDEDESDDEDYTFADDVAWWMDMEKQLQRDYRRTRPDVLDELDGLIDRLFREPDEPDRI